MSANLYLSTGGEPVGPLSLSEVRHRVQAGQAGPDSLVWHEGLEGWVKLANFIPLQELFQSAPAAASAATPAAALQAPDPKTSDPKAYDDAQDRVFVDLIKKSWKHYNAHHFAEHIDEVLVGALITTTLDQGYALIDLTSDGTAHYLRLEHQESRARVVYRMRHMTTSLVSAKVLGHMTSVIIGYGEPVTDFTRIWQALRAEYKSGYIQSAEPGTITVDGDMASGYVYVQVDMYWNLQDYIEEDYTIHYDRIGRDTGATLHALRKYLRGRLGR